MLKLKNILPLIFLSFFVTSCFSIPDHIVTDQEKAVLHSLEDELKGEISIKASKDLFRFIKPYDFVITASNIKANKRGFKGLTDYAVKKYYPVMNHKERYKNLIITIESQTEGNVAAGMDVSFTYPLDEL